MLEAFLLFGKVFGKELFLQGSNEALGGENSLSGRKGEGRIVPVEGPGPHRDRIVLEDGLFLRSTAPTHSHQQREADVVLCQLPVRKTLRIVLDHAGSLRPPSVSHGVLLSVSPALSE